MAAEKVTGVHLLDGIKAMILSFTIDPSLPEARKDEVLGKLITSNISSFFKPGDGPFMDFMDTWWKVYHANSLTARINELSCDIYTTGHWELTTENPFWGCNITDCRLTGYHDTRRPEDGPTVQFDSNYPVYKKTHNASKIWMSHRNAWYTLVYYMYIGRVRPDFASGLANRWVLIVQVGNRGSPHAGPEWTYTFIQKFSKERNLPTLPRTRSGKNWCNWLTIE